MGASSRSRRGRPPTAFGSKRARHMRVGLAIGAVATFVLLGAAVSGCDHYSGSAGGGNRNGSASGGGVDPTPENKYGVPSGEFEPDDIARANGASERVREYCAGAVSEAQEVGCLSHVDA